ncbi:MAG: uracil-DNA glycosylase [Acidimicrobiales bacterium]
MVTEALFAGLSLGELGQEAASCARCQLAASRTNVVFGAGRAGAEIMLVGEGPGRDEDLSGQPFVGRSGRLLDQLVAQEMGLARGDVYIANVVKCRPPANRNPLPAEVDACRPFLERQVELVSPLLLVTLGNFATRLLLGTEAPIGTLRGRLSSYRGTPLIPTYHPAAALRGGGEVVAKMRADLARASSALVRLRRGEEASRGG